MSIDGKTLLRPTLAETGFVWFHRIIASYCLLFGVFYWTRLVGIHEGPFNRFDLMPVEWQIAAAALSVLYPFAASGLWMMASWGPVIWFLCATAETAMHLGFPELFGERPILLASHAAVAVLYVAFRLVIWWQLRPRD